MEGRYPNKLLPYLLLLPSVLVVLVFLVIPSVQALVQSLRLVDPFTGRGFYVGLRNFVDLFTSEEYRHSIVVSVIFAAGTTLLGLSAGLGLALLANQSLRGAWLYRTALLWPYALSPAVAGAIWGLLMDPSAGPVTYLLRRLTGGSFNWMVDGPLALALVTVASGWKMLGYNIVFFLAGLQAIPSELMEAASVDGASAWSRFWKVRFPLLSPVTFFLLIMNTLESFFENFGLIDVLTQGGPARATDILVYKLYRDGFVNIQWGLASAQSITLFVMVALLTILQFRYGGRRVFYG